jgi:hypothetical protein
MRLKNVINHKGTQRIPQWGTKESIIEPLSPLCTLVVKSLTDRKRIWTGTH